jgi:four helix bundle protein
MGYDRKEIILKGKSFDFAVKITNLYKYILENKKENILNKQLLRSGTAVGALIREAQNGESKADFIHKLSIAQKECDETIYWLELLRMTDFISKKEFESINRDAIALLKMLRSAIIITKKLKDNNP